MAMDFAALPPEVNSARMYAGPGSGPMLAAASSWDSLAAELQSAAAAYSTAISDLTSEAWVGPSSTSMAAAAAPYVAWLNDTAAQAEQTGLRAKAAAAAYAAAFAMTVPPPVIAANRVLQASLIATNILGQNTPAIMVTEAHYMEMWAQDATAMYGYAGDSAAASTLTPFTPPPTTTNPAGVGNQAAATAQAAGTSAGTGQGTISQLITSLLNSFASPGTSPTGLAAAPTPTTPTPTPTPTGGGLFGSIDPGSFMQGMATQYGFLPGLFGMFMGANALGPLMATPINMALTSAGTSAAAPIAGLSPIAGLPGIAAMPGLAAGSLGGGALSAGLASSVGAATSVGALSVPPTWAVAAATPLEALAPAALPMAMSAGEVGGAGMIGAPLFLSALPRAAMAASSSGPGTAAGLGSAASKYDPPLKVVSRPAAAGYAAEPTDPPITKYRYPTVDGYSLNGHTPAGYRAAIVYLPITDDEPATV